MFLILLFIGFWSVFVLVWLRIPKTIYICARMPAIAIPGGQRDPQGYSCERGPGVKKPKIGASVHGKNNHEERYRALE